ncbi:MAG: hypothetical protein Q6J33_00050 [Gloeomargarita sp. DG_2_bins_126]
MPYKSTGEYMSWNECRARCPRGAIRYTDHHYCLDQGLCDRCQNLSESVCGGIFEDNAPQQLEDFNAYWRDWFQKYQKRLVHLQKLRS